MKKWMTLFFVFFLAANGMAQKIKPIYSAGPACLIPTYSQINSAGLGFGLRVDFNPHNKISIVSDMEFNAFRSDVKNQFTNTTTEGFVIMPIFAGIKWMAYERIYFSGQGGVTIGLKNARTNIALSPGCGYVIPINGEPKLDIGLRLIGVLPKTSIPENTFLEKGGYSYLSLKLAYMF